MSKYYYFVFIVLIQIYNLQVFASKESSEPKIANRSTEILAAINIDNYAHIGGLDNLLVIIEKAALFDPKIKEGNVLDVGSRRGQRAAYFLKSGFDRVWGIDISQDNIDFAKKRYPNIKFVLGDVLDVTDIFEDGFFSAVCMFNIVSVVESQAEMIQKLKEVSTNDGILVISDYSVLDKSKKTITNFLGRTIIPMDIDHYKPLLDFLGYEILDIEDVGKEYHSWFSLLLGSIALKEKQLLASGFSKEEINLTKEYIQNNIDLFKKSSVGALVIYARRK